MPHVGLDDLAAVEVAVLDRPGGEGGQAAEGCGQRGCRPAVGEEGDVGGDPGQVTVLVRGLAGFQVPEIGHLRPVATGFHGVHGDGGEAEQQAFEGAFHRDAEVVVGVRQPRSVHQEDGVLVVAQGCVGEVVFF
ncbi:hypothetical protein G3I32_39385 [Streptomyces coelicoflavus]|uniref:Uncharacterized protein n=1 Tax=Streptomyces coelicoflavus TaxID=285562 RepID=A0A7K3Q057_9ACTN|nr:hypothetical protein [Streptomyces coelicoflavus]NEB14819.1 hypothetical protein [Streptomyces coelicoflavus]